MPSFSPVTSIGQDQDGIWPDHPVILTHSLMLSPSLGFKPDQIISVVGSSGMKFCSAPSPIIYMAYLTNCSNFRVDVVKCLSEVKRNDTLMDQPHRLSKGCQRQLRVELLQRVSFFQLIMKYCFHSVTYGEILVITCFSFSGWNYQPGPWFERQVQSWYWRTLL